MKQKNKIYKDYDNALKAQKERYLRRVKEMIKSNCYRCFILTFTFSDKTLKETNETTRLRYVKSFLNKQAEQYILNRDYGGKYGREHYHAFILSRYNVINFNAYKIGNLNARKFYYRGRHNTMSDIEITNHAFKETAEQNKIIYSRASSKIDANFSKECSELLSKYLKSRNIPH